MSVLNPILLDVMEQEFGRRNVQVTYHGQPLVGFYQTMSPSGQPGRYLKIIRRGETYSTDCPFCNDRRGRMAVNHRYGVHDPQTGFNGYELWKCYNEECQNDPDNRRDLKDRLREPLLRRGRDRTRLCPRMEPVVVTDNRGLEPCEFPGLLASLNDLPSEHPAIRYLRERKFDPDELVRLWQVAYAVAVPARLYGSRSEGRIIIPVHRDGVMVGWQARYAGELDWKASPEPKYLTFFPKSLTLYGIDQCVGAPHLVLVEGVTDVWRYGPGAVSGLGKKLSPTQSRLLVERLNGRPVVMIPDANDPKAYDSFCASASMLIADGHTGPIGIAPLQPGTDPAKMDRGALRRLVDAASRAAAPP